MSDKQILLRYEGETCVLDDHWTDGLEDVGHIRYMWEEGNYSCDCNRGPFLFGQYPDAPEELENMTCGDTIELVSHWAFEVEQ